MCEGVPLLTLVLSLGHFHAVGFPCPILSVFFNLSLLYLFCHVSGLSLRSLLFSKERQKGSESGW